MAGRICAFDGPRKGRTRCPKNNANAIPAIRTFQFQTSSSVNTNGTQHDDYTYDQNGNLTGAPPRNVDGVVYDPLTLTYDLYLNLVSSAAVGAATTLYRYNDANQRVLKSSAASGLLYLHGMNTLPLVTWDGSTETRYLYGPTGLIAVQKDGDENFVLKDHQGSVRLMFASGDPATATAS